MAAISLEPKSLSEQNQNITFKKNINNCSNLLGYKAKFSNGAIFRLFLNKENSEEICNKVIQDLKKNDSSSIEVYEFKYPHKKTKIDIYYPLERIADKNNNNEQFEKVWNDEQQRYFVKRYHKYNNDTSAMSDISSIKDWPHLPQKENKSNDGEKKLSNKLEENKTDSGFVDNFLKNFSNLPKNIKQQTNNKQNIKSELTSEKNIKKKLNSIIPENKKHFINLINKEINKMYTTLQEKTGEYSKLFEQAKNAEKNMNDYHNALQEKKK